MQGRKRSKHSTSTPEVPGPHLFSVLVLLHGLGQTAPNQHHENLSTCCDRKSSSSCRWKGYSNVAWHLEARKTAAVRYLLERFIQ